MPSTIIWIRLGSNPNLQKSMNSSHKALHNLTSLPLGMGIVRPSLISSNLNLTTTILMQLVR